MQRIARPVVAAIALLSVLSASTLVALPATAAPACAQLEVGEVRPDQSLLMIAVYADAASYDKSPVAQIQLRADAATMTVPVCNLAAAPQLAFRLYQDLNGNGKLDRNVLGIPSEPWAASGKAPAMSAPTWETTAVANDGSVIVVKLSK